MQLGDEVVRRLHDELVAPIAVREDNRKTNGTWSRKWRLVSMDGSTLDVADTETCAQRK